MKTMDIESRITIAPIDTSSAAEATKQAVITLAEASALTITDQPGYDKAGSILSAIKGRIKSLDALRKSIVKPLDEARSRVQDLFRGPLESYTQAEDVIKRGMITYNEAQESLRRKEQERLERIAEAERQKKAAQEAEWRRKEEEKRREAERLALEASKIKNAKARAEAEAQAAKAKAEADKAQAKADERAFEQQNIVAPVAQPKVEAVKGTSYRDQWYGEVVDFKLLPDAYKVADMSKIDKTLNAQKGTLPIPGVVIKVKKIMSSRSA